ncbi:MAG: TetR family transcriptional regulator [Acidobacteriia bacterium]|nr:TetR family transcriptional regulator [Terriglobia bacterium]
MSTTRDKILDTAEHLIADHGFAATSLRQIIAEAGVNLAAVHYHFGSKQDLLDQLILRKVSRVNAEREALLDQFEREASPEPVPVEKILKAFFEPMIETGCRNPQFVRLMGRMIAEGLIPAIAEKHFHPTASRFVKAFRRALPNLPEGELFWRMQFMFGAMSQGVVGLSAPFMGIERDTADFPTIMRRLIQFLTAAIQAPATEEVQANENCSVAG